MNESAEIKALVEAWFQSASSGDASLVAKHVKDSPMTRLIGSDPDEWKQGAEVAEFLRGEVEGSAGNAKFAPRDIEAYEHGDAGWAAARLTITLPDGRSVSPRWTSVFVREGGTWKFVQTHASIAVPNDQIGWTYAGWEQALCNCLASALRLSHGL